MTITIQPLMQTRIITNRINSYKINNTNQNKSEISMKSKLISKPQACFYRLLDFIIGQRRNAGIWIMGSGAGYIGFALYKNYPELDQKFGLALVATGLMLQALINGMRRKP